MRNSRQPKEDFEGISIKDSNLLYTEYRVDDIIVDFTQFYNCIFSKFLTSSPFRGNPYGIS